MLYIRVEFPFQSLVKFAERENQTDYLNHDLKLTANKNFSLQVSRWSFTEIFSASMDLSLIGRDHAGPEFAITILGFGLTIGVHDRRHWNYEAHRWMTDQESIAALDDFS